MPTNVRRSTRNSRSRVLYSPDSVATLKNRKVKEKRKSREVSTGAITHQLLDKKSEEKEEDSVQNLKDSDEEYSVEEEEVEEELEVPKKKVVWENYTKKDLYYHWLKARNDATDLRKERNDLDAARKEQVKAFKELKKELKLAENQLGKQNAVHNKNGTLQKQLDEEKAKGQRNRLERQNLMENKEIMVKNIKESYENMTLKQELKSSAALQSFELKFAECNLKLKAKDTELKALADENKALKKKNEKFETLLFQKSKGDIEVHTMDSKNQLR